MAAGAGRAAAGGGVRLSATTPAELVGAHLDAFAERRAKAGVQFFAEHAQALATVCHRMAERFARGGRLVAVGRSPAARSDARHVAVEFVHPVIVGKRALPAIGLAGEGGELAAQLDLIARRNDIAIAFGTDEDEGEGARALGLARERGCLTIAFSPAGAEWEFSPASDDRYLRQELIETLYHVLWELVHVFFEHRGLLEGRDVRREHDAGASSFLYPFLGELERDLTPVLEDVRRSALMKAEEVSLLREQTLAENRESLLAAAGALRARLQRGGKLLAAGNGGSATDAMDVVADFHAPLHGARGWPALDLCEDCAIVTAIANDIGVDAIFSRQVIAYGLPGDALLALSTSGNSVNVIEALQEARRRGLYTIAMVGYDGGRVAAEALADCVVITRSEHIPRIQEAQASAYHVLRELVEHAGAGGDGG
ncbi:MAG TPA: SIS domain-containing protein [Solirubrobacteraceae bacterium]|jgi:D-sedoheptulose 7-phosphate isomerase|nr:SIS domain-containing protein [Solirubrobacteraceae bacterium]